VNRARYEFRRTFAKLIVLLQYVYLPTNYLKNQGFNYCDPPHLCVGRFCRGIPQTYIASISCNS